MPMVFPDIDSLQVFVNNNIKENHAEEITGVIANDAFNGCIEFIRQSPLNYGKASIESSGGAVIASTAVVVFTGTTPTSLTWGDDIYNEYVFVNTTSNVIPLAGSLVYYNLTGSAVAAIPPNSIINVFKANNDLWIQGNNPGGGAGTGTVTSVGLTMPTDIFNVANSPILAAGDLVVTKKVQNANTFFRGPTSGVPAIPTFGVIVPGDVPFVFPDTNSFIIDGGQIVWVENLDYNVSAANYVINDAQYSSAETLITLAPSDPTFDRIDLVLVNTAGNVVVITGTASANPQQPSYSQSTQLPLSFILVTAGSTQPACAFLTTVYKQDAGTPTEWATVSSSGSIVVNSTNNPRTGTKDIEGTNVVEAATVTFTPLAAFNSNGFTQLDMYIRSKATWNNILRVTFYDIGGQVGNAIEITPSASFGFNSSTVGSYQQIGIPKELFGLVAATMITSMRFTIIGATSTMGFYIDDISLEFNCLISPSPTSLVFINGLNRLGSDVRWGGDLLGLTNINQNGHSVSFNQTNTGIFQIYDEGTYKPAQLYMVDPTYQTTFNSWGEIRGWYNDIKLLGNASLVNLSSHLYGGITLNPNSNIGGYNFIIKSGREQLSKGANIIAANNLTLGADGNSFTVTGNTQINGITNTNWQSGSTAYLLFTGTPTVKNNTAAGPTEATILLAGGVDFVAAAGDILSLLYDGTNWRETTRELGSVSPGSTALSSITAATATNTIDNGTFKQEWQWNTLDGLNGLKLSSTSTVTTSSGYLFQSVLTGASANSGVGTIAGYFQNFKTGTSSNNYGVNANVQSGTNNRGLTSLTAGGTGLNYGVDITVSGGGTTADNRGITAAVSGGASAIGGYFAATGGVVNYAIIVPASSGRVGFGTSTPTALLHLAAGTAAASTAPLKLTTGTALTAIEDGAIEYHTSHLYFSIGGTRYQLDQQTGTSYTASNGLTLSASDFTLGGALTGNTTITAAALQLAMTFNTLAGTSGLDLSSTSTLAASSLQKVLNISLSGVNANSGQATYGIYVSNTHTGTSATNRGVYATVSGTAAIAIYGVATGAGVAAVRGDGDTYGVQGVGSGAGVAGTVTAASAQAVFASHTGTSGTGYGLYADVNGAKTTGIAGYFTSTGATNNHAIVVPSGGGQVGFQTLTPTAFLHIGAGTTGFAQLRLAAGVAPSSPNDGDIYYIDTADRLMFFKNATACEIVSASAVTTEVIVSDTSLTVTFNGTTYKLLARA